MLRKHRKMHLPGSVEPRAASGFQQVETRCPDYGDLGFQAFRGPAWWGEPARGMLICNDRGWLEALRAYGLRGLEMLMVGYNSATYDPNGGESENAALRAFHSHLLAQANASIHASWAAARRRRGRRTGPA